MLVNGEWKTKRAPVQAKDEDGRFIRQESQFRHWITPDGSSGPSGDGGFAAEAGRYHLSVALICPWSSRTLMVRSLKGLEDVITVSVLNPVLTDQGWRFGGFPGADEDGLNGAAYMHELSTKAEPNFSGRATVPVLWDKQRQTIVNNESADIVRMLNGAFDELTGPQPDLYPAHLAADIESLNDELFRTLNNGVYEAGFATTQKAYEEAYANVFNMLDTLEARLDDGREYLLGDTLSESDIRLFVTLVRFDLAYHGLFKCNRNLLAQMPSLTAYTERIQTLPGVTGTVDPEHIKQGYYSVKGLNPNGIVPLGPA